MAKFEISDRNLNFCDREVIEKIKENFVKNIIKINNGNFINGKFHEEDEKIIFNFSLINFRNLLFFYKKINVNVRVETRDFRKIKISTCTSYSPFYPFYKFRLKRIIKKAMNETLKR